jgi:nicotinate phosphoribosyltransferase
VTPRPSTALCTDRYELTMLDAALQSGAAASRATFEVFTRRLPPGRRYGVFTGLGRVLDSLEDFRFGPAELTWLRAGGLVSEPTLEWLAGFRFSGHIDAYAEGECYTAGSPVLTVEGTFGESVLLETMILSVLNHDSAVGAAASLIVSASAGRGLIEMGSRRTDLEAAVASARAAYIAGFSTTSNLEAGRRYGIPTAGTAAHAFVLAHDSERAAFAAQVAALGPATTLLVDTYDVDAGIRTAVDVAGPGLGAIRIDSGDLAEEARRARRLLDALGATGTRILVTGDLDDVLLGPLADAPVDGYGVGTNVVTGLGQPTAGFVYKLVEVEDPGGHRHPVAKRSPGKESVGGRKRAWRVRLPAVPDHAEGPVTGAGGQPWSGPVWADLVGMAASADADAPDGGRPLQRRVVDGGDVVERVPLDEARAWHHDRREEIPAPQPLVLIRPPLDPR